MDKSTSAQLSFAILGVTNLCQRGSRKECNRNGGWSRVAQSLVIFELLYCRMFINLFIYFSYYSNRDVLLAKSKHMFIYLRYFINKREKPIINCMFMLKFVTQGQTGPLHVGNTPLSLA